MLPTSTYNCAYHQSALWTSSATGVMPPTTHGICNLRNKICGDDAGKEIDLMHNDGVRPFTFTRIFAFSLSFSFSHMIGYA